MIPLTVAEVAQVVGADVVGAHVVGADGVGPQVTGKGRPGTGDPAAVVQAVVADSRAVSPGALFVAMSGARVDGHDYVLGALAAGAVAALTQRPVPDAAGPCLVVEDPLRALARLTRHVVDRAAASGLQVIGLTGSQGKTSTKDLLAQILEPVGPTVAPHGNLNNELGVPLTALRVESATRFLVVEMGARGVGHIAYLCGLTPPRVGLELNVGHAHLSEFGSQQAIAQAKGELVEALPGDGVAVLNADDPLVWAMAERTRARVIGFSIRSAPTTPDAVWATDITVDELSRARFVLHGRRGDGATAHAEVELSLTGLHHVANAVAAAAAALAVGVDLAVAAAGLTAARPPARGRMELHERADDVLVVNDAYNANPESARAAVDTLAEVGRARRRRFPGARTWAVLGDMLELGAGAEADHRALGQRVGEQHVDHLVAVGEWAAALAAGARSAGLDPSAVLTLHEKSRVAPYVLPRLGPGDAVLVKASRGLALDTVAEEIWTAPPARQPGGDDADGTGEQATDSEDPA